jgi:hypothetical protein
MNIPNFSNPPKGENPTEHQLGRRRKSIWQAAISNVSGEPFMSRMMSLIQVNRSIDAVVFGSAMSDDGDLMVLLGQMTVCTGSSMIEHCQSCTMGKLKDVPRADGAQEWSPLQC